MGGMRAGLLVAGALAILAAPPALAQDASSTAPDAASAESTVPDQLQDMVGDFVLTQDDDNLPTCPVTLTDQQVAGGWAIEVPETCPAPYPAAGRLVAWNVDDADGSVTFLDADRQVVLRLFQDDDGVFDTDPGVSPRFFLLPPYAENGTGGEDDGD
jgi:hypothetical protein